VRILFIAASHSFWVRKPALVTRRRRPVNTASGHYVQGSRGSGPGPSSWSVSGSMLSVEARVHSSSSRSFSAIHESCSSSSTRRFSLVEGASRSLVKVLATASRRLRY
jgi:hypothetical protein